MIGVLIGPGLTAFTRIFFSSISDAITLVNERTAALLAMATAGVYSASKAAVRSFTKVIASEMLEKNIRVNAVSPGPIKTPIIGRRADEKAVRQTWDYLASVIPMKRMGEAEEVAKAVLFLSSDDSSFTTGTELQVDGGSVDLNLFEGNKYERRE